VQPCILASSGGREHCPTPHGRMQTTNSCCRSGSGCLASCNAWASNHCSCAWSGARVQYRLKLTKPPGGDADWQTLVLVYLPAAQQQSGEGQNDPKQLSAQRFIVAGWYPGRQPHYCFERTCLRVTVPCPHPLLSRVPTCSIPTASGASSCLNSAYNEDCTSPHHQTMTQTGRQ
jgi:hypothetical protein